ncbi:MAG TPA: hypothetical protein VK465_17605 [Fibrobacteria bacterium]|nr:hypothetical protein [Fibrobacteria bacterium]
MHSNDVRAKLIQVIEVEHLRGGDEATGLPMRWVKTYWDLKGNLLSEADPLLAEMHRKNSAPHANATTTDIFRR